MCAVLKPALAIYDPNALKICWCAQICVNASHGRTIVQNLTSQQIVKWSTLTVIFLNCSEINNSCIIFRFLVHERVLIFAFYYLYFESMKYSIMSNKFPRRANFSQKWTVFVLNIPRDTQTRPKNRKTKINRQTQIW